MFHPRLALTALCVATVATVLGGCATAITRGTSTVDLLDLNAPGGDGLAYSLLDGGREPIGRAVSRDGRIRFDLPTDRPVGRCVVVLDQAGASALGERPAIALGLRAEFDEVQAQRQRLAARQASLVAAATAVRQDADAVRARLQANPAHVQGSCRRPAELPAPARPAMRCATRDDCQRDGAALCFTRQYGAGGCDRAARELGLAGLGSNPLCQPAAAERASRGVDEAIFDAVRNAAADVARSLQGSDDPATKAIGGVVANASDYARISSARSCTEAYVDRELAPLEAWAARVRQARDEPQRLLDRCEAETLALRDVEQRGGTTATQSEALAVQIGELDGRLAALRRERRVIDWCGSGSEGGSMSSSDGSGRSGGSVAPNGRAVQ